MPTRSGGGWRSWWRAAYARRPYVLYAVIIVVMLGYGCSLVTDQLVSRYEANTPRDADGWLADGGPIYLGPADASRAVLMVHGFSGTPDVSWADFARAIFDKAGLTPEVSDIPTTDYPTPAARPLNSRLDCSTTEATFGITRPDWRAHLDAVLTELR